MRSATDRDLLEKLLHFRRATARTLDFQSRAATGQSDDRHDLRFGDSPSFLRSEAQSVAEVAIFLRVMPSSGGYLQEGNLRVGARHEHLMSERTFSRKKTLKLAGMAIGGEHGGDPKSVKFCHSLGLSYVSCSPFRVPIARLGHRPSRARAVAQSLRLPMLANFSHPQFFQGTCNQTLRESSR